MKSTLPDFNGYIIKQSHSLFTDVEGEQTSKTITFDPTETEKAITFNVTDNDITLEPIKQYELFLEGTHRKYNLLFKRNNKTTINILDDEGMYYHQEIFMRLV